MEMRAEERERGNEHRQEVEKEGPLSLGHGMGFEEGAAPVGCVEGRRVGERSAVEQADGFDEGNQVRVADTALAQARDCQLLLEVLPRRKGIGIHSCIGLLLWSES